MGNPQVRQSPEDDDFAFFRSVEIDPAAKEDLDFFRSLDSEQVAPTGGVVEGIRAAANVPLPGGVVPGRVIETAIGAAEVVPEFLRRKTLAAGNLVKKAREGMVSFQDVIDVIKPEPDILALPFTPGASLGMLVTEKEDRRFTSFPEVLEQLDVPEGPKVKIPGTEIEVSSRTLAGLAIEAVIPSAPVIGKLPKVKLNKARNIIEKGADATRAEQKFAQEVVDEFEQAIPSADDFAKAQRQKLRERLIAEGARDEPPLVKPRSEVKPEAFVSERSLTSARVADIEQDRALLGLDSLGSPAKKKWGVSLGNARKKGLDRKATRIADEVIENPRPLNDEETAGLVVHSARLKKEYKAANDEIAKLTDDAEVKVKSAEISRIEEEFEKVSFALRATGTEQGRALASRKLTIDEDFELVSIVTRAKAASGKPLKPKQRAKFEKLTRDLEAKTQRVAELEQQLADVSASRIVRRGTNRFKKMTAAQREKDIEALMRKAEDLIKSGCGR